MSESENVNLVKVAYSNFQHGNIEGVIETLSDDVNWTLPEIDGVPFTGKTVGRDGVRQFFADLAQHEEITRFEPHEFIAQGDKVVCLGSSTARVHATGREVTTDFCHVFTIADGKTTHFNEFLDTAAIRAAYQKAQTA